ncbi:MAG TPA: hypothetical protein VFA03_08585 [Acetobacteraceae bacterium]|nr:hypothetical protein [Acetobacteraceae bacterium]
MNVKGRIGIAAHPDLRLRARTERMEFRTHGAATLAFATQQIRMEVGAIPLHLAIPFHKHRRVLAGSVGPFRLTVRPVEASVRVSDAHMTGTLGGDEGIAAEAHVVGNCKAEIELAGEAPGRVLKAAFEGVFEE